MKRSVKSRMVLLLAAFGTLLVTGDQARADFAFGKPRNLGPAINSGLDQAEASIASDGLSLYFSHGTFGAVFSLYVANRPARAQTALPASGAGVLVVVLRIQHGRVVQLAVVTRGDAMHAVDPLFVRPQPIVDAGPDRVGVHVREYVDLVRGRARSHSASPSASSRGAK